MVANAGARFIERCDFKILKKIGKTQQFAGK
jgi:hypothetical protein